MVMPDGYGPALAARLRAVDPTLKVIFMSGYPRAVAWQMTGLDEGAPFLQKPFLADDLVRQVREIVDH